MNQVNNEEAYIENVINYVQVENTNIEKLTKLVKKYNLKYLEIQKQG